MKNILIFSVLSAFLLTGCLWAFDHNKIKGSGTVTKEKREVSPFDKIDVTGAFTVFLSQGDEESVVVEIDENLQQYITVQNEGSKLILGIKDKINFGKTVKNNIFVTVKDIDLFRVTGVCTLKSIDALNFGDFTLKVSGVAKGDLEVHGNKLNVNLSGVSHVELSGSATELIINQSGVGNFNAKNIEAEKVSVTNSGVGSVSVYATQELSMNNSGVGSITYSGDANIKSINSSGVGKIKKAN